MSGMEERRTCSVAGCNRPTIARGLCTKHYQRWQRHGDPLKTRAYEGAHCKIEGCAKPAKALGLCRAHYWRFKTHGDALGGRTALGEPQKFLTKAIAYDGDECLRWPFGQNGLGYGIIHIDGKPQLVSRVVCESVNGPPTTPEHEAAHHCGKGHEGCVTPKHLYWATPSENQMDRVRHDTHQRGERHPLVKLTEDQVREIRELGKTTPHQEIADRYGIGRTQVSRIITRKRWGWLR